MMAGGLSLMMIVMMMFSGSPGNDLIDYVPTDGYWKNKMVVVSEEQMIAELGKAVTGDPEELVKLLNADKFKVRQKATEDLRAMGPAAIPALKKAAKSSDVEVSTRAKQVLDALGPASGNSRSVRRLMAIRAIGENGYKKALPLLRQLARSDDFFEADYAKAAIAKMEGKEYARPVVDRTTMSKALCFLPADSGVVAQIGLVGGGPIDYIDLIEKQQKAMKDMMAASGAGPDAMGAMPDASAMLDQVVAVAVPIVERLGNIRINSVTLSVDSEVGDNKGFIAIVVDGVYSRNAVKAELMKLGNMNQSKVEGIEVFSPEDEICIMPVSDRTFVFAGGPDRMNMPVEEILGLIRSKSTKVSFGKDLMNIVGGIAPQARMWAAALISADNKKIDFMKPFDKASLSGIEKDGKLMVELNAQGNDAEKMALRAATIKGQVDNIKKELLNEQGPQAEMFKPVKSILESFKISSSGKDLRMSVELPGGNSSIALLPMLFFGVGRVQMMDQGPMPPPEVIDQRPMPPEVIE